MPAADVDPDESTSRAPVLGSNASSQRSRPPKVVRSKPIVLDRGLEEPSHKESPASQADRVGLSGPRKIGRRGFGVGAGTGAGRHKAAKVKEATNDGFLPSPSDVIVIRPFTGERHQELSGKRIAETRRQPPAYSVDKPEQVPSTVPSVVLFDSMVISRRPIRSTGRAQQDPSAIPPDSSVLLSGYQEPGRSSAQKLDRQQTDSGYATAANQMVADPYLSTADNRLAGDGSADDDANTTYSDTTTMPLCDIRHYITELSNEIIKSLGQFEDLNLTAREATSGSLGDFVKALAVKIGHESGSRVNQEVMYFIHKYHR